MLFRLSEAVAELIFSIGNLSLIVGAVFVLLGSILVPWSAGERDRYSNEKVADARRIAGQANEQAGLANERAAKLELKAQMAALETQQLKAQFAWRELTPEAHSELVKALVSKPSSINIAVPASDTEATYFAYQIIKAFEEASWSVHVWYPTYPGEIFDKSVLKDSDDETTQDVAKALEATGIPFVKRNLTTPTVSYGVRNISLSTDLLIGSHLPLSR